MPQIWQTDFIYQHHALSIQCREKAGREASLTAAIIDSQSVKSAGKRGSVIDPPGYDAGKMWICAARDP